MTIPEETGKVATTAINALQGNPLCISLLVLVSIFGFYSYFKTMAAIEGRTQAIMALIAKCQPGPEPQP